MKTKTTEMAAGTNLPDFKKVSMDSVGEITLPIILGFFTFLRTVMTWFEVEGKKLLEQPESLTFEQWDELHTNSWLLYTRLGRTQGGAVSELHLRVLRKGIASLIYWVHHTYIRDLSAENGRIFGRWLAEIKREVRVGGPFGLQSHLCTKEKSWELVESLVPIAQALHSEPILKSIAMERYAGDDKMSVELFIKAHKNWR